MTTGINPNKVEEVRTVMFRNAVSLFTTVLENGVRLGILLGIDEDRREACIANLRKTMHKTTDPEFVFAIMCEDSEGYTKKLFRGMVREYLGIQGRGTSPSINNLVVETKGGR